MSTPLSQQEHGELATYAETVAHSLRSVGFDQLSEREQVLTLNVLDRCAAALRTPLNAAVPAPIEVPTTLLCVKCGGTDIHTRFYREDADDIQPSLRFDAKDCRWANIPMGCRNAHGSIRATHDLLYRRCRTCSWWWTEMPCDAIPGTLAEAHNG